MNWLIAVLVAALMVTCVFGLIVIDDNPPTNTNVIYSPMPNLPKPTLPEGE